MESRVYAPRSHLNLYTWHVENPIVMICAEPSVGSDLRLRNTSLHSLCKKVVLDLLPKVAMLARLCIG